MCLGCCFRTGRERPVSGAPPLRNQKFADSPLERDGFELLVPRHESLGFSAREVSHIAFFGLLVAGDAAGVPSTHRGIEPRRSSVWISRRKPPRSPASHNLLKPCPAWLDGVARGPGDERLNHQVVSFKSPADTPTMPGMLRKSTAFVPRYQKFESISLQPPAVSPCKPAPPWWVSSQSHLRSLP